MRCASPASSRTPRSELDDLLLALRVAVSLAAVLGVLWYLQRRLTRRGAAPRRGAHGITVLSRQSLGGKAQLVVVEVDGTRYVLGVAEQGVSVVDRTRSPQPIGAPARQDAAARPDAPARDAGADVVTGFERLLATAAADADRPADAGRPADEPAAPLRRDRRPRSAATADPLHGSILSPGTWRQTAQALRRIR